MSAEEAGKFLEEGTFRVVERRSETDGVVEVRRYRAKNSITYNYIDSRAWDLVFKDGKLTGWKEVTRAPSASSGNGGMGFLCKDAIARGDDMAIRVHCN
ncbi:MAG: hypothetical protein HY204_10030 [Nitrospirae bacterium]|nr:hypothetical protein [Nitrospirota bacterium]